MQVRNLCMLLVIALLAVFIGFITPDWVAATNPSPWSEWKQLWCVVIYCSWYSTDTLVWVIYFSWTDSGGSAWHGETTAGSKTREWDKAVWGGTLWLTQQFRMCLFRCLLYLHSIAKTFVIWVHGNSFTVVYVREVQVNWNAMQPWSGLIFVIHITCHNYVQCWGEKTHYYNVVKS